VHYPELKTAWAELTGPGGAFEIVETPVRGQMLRTYKNAPPNIRALWLSTAAFADASPTPRRTRGWPPSRRGSKLGA
jgi:long-chain acyl-CoA synthetase